MKPQTKTKIMNNWKKETGVPKKLQGERAKLNTAAVKKGF